jgi:hypothetical protein
VLQPPGRQECQGVLVEAVEAHPGIYGELGVAIGLGISYDGQ